MCRLVDNCTVAILLVFIIIRPVYPSINFISVHNNKVDVHGVSVAFEIEIDEAKKRGLAQLIQTESKYKHTQDIIASVFH